MSITVIAFLLLLALMPGIIFRRAYFLFPFFRKYSKHTISSDLIGIMLTAIIFHLLFLFPISWTSNIVKEFKSEMLDILDKYYNSGQLDLHYIKTLWYSPIIYYNVSLWILAAYLGFLINKVVVTFKFDTRTRVFRFGNEWFYYLKGRILDFPQFKGSSKNIHIVYADVLVDTVDGSILYMGICSDYSLAENGGLANICLTGTKRRKLAEDDIGKEGHYEIPSNIVIIPGEQIKNINLRYFERTTPGPKPKSNFISKLYKLWGYFLLVGIVIYIFNMYEKSKSNKPKNPL